MMAQLKATITRRPLLVFLVLAIAPYVVITAVTSQDWVGGYQTVVVGLAALLCCWAMSEPREGSRHLAARVSIVGAATFAIFLLTAVQLRLFSGEEGPNQSLQDAMGVILRYRIFWANAIVAGIVLSGVLSRATMVRRYAQALVRRVSCPRVLVAVALVAPAAAAVLAVLLERAFPAEGGSEMSFRLPLAYFAAGFFGSLLSYLPLVFAWYGFAMERLTLRISPLLAALAIGLATQLPEQVMGIVVPLLRHSPQHYGMSDVLDLAYAVAIAVTAVWLAQEGRRSLVPTTLFLAAVSVASGATFSWGGTTLEDIIKTGDIYSWLIVALAAVLALSGRLWRRPEAEDAKGLSTEGAALQTST